MTEIELEVQDLRRRLKQKEDEVKAHRAELGVAQEALFWTRGKLQDVQEENRRLKNIILAQEEARQ